MRAKPLPAVKGENAHRYGRPRKQKRDDQTRLLMSPPEMHLRVQHEPVDRNRKLQKQDERGQPAQESHVRMVFELTTRANQ
jgi:hypothetical protein